MDEVQDFCVRMLGDGQSAVEAEKLARSSGGSERVRVFSAAVAACRQVGADRPPAEPAAAPERQDELALVDAVAGELARATARLPQRQREALALREQLCLSHAQVAAVIGVEPAAVAPLLARARLRLRSELRGGAPPTSDCAERDRALRTIALRQDGEDFLPVDEDWLLDHLGHCSGCAQTHSAMLEASACYRAWRVSAPPNGAQPARPASEAAGAEDPTAASPSR